VSLCSTKYHAMKTTYPLHDCRHLYPHTRNLTPREGALGTHWTGCWVGTRTGLDTAVKRKIPSPAGNRNPVVQPVVQSYWMSYPAPVKRIQRKISSSCVYSVISVATLQRTSRPVRYAVARNVFVKYVYSIHFHSYWTICWRTPCSATRNSCHLEQSVIFLPLYLW
jgi:hypothetical protein